MKLILFSARRWSFVDDKTGEARQGVTVQYSDGLGVNEGNERGIFPMTISGTPDVWGQLSAVPGVYQCDLKMRPGKDNKAALSLVSVKLIEGLPLGGICE